MKEKKEKKEERKKNRINLFILLFNYNYFCNLFFKQNLKILSNIYLYY